MDSPRLVAFLDPGWLSIYFTVFKYCGFRRVRRHYLARLKLKTQEQREEWLRTVEQRIGTARREPSPALSPQEPDEE